MDYKGAKAFILEKLDKELKPVYTYHGKHHTLDVLNVTTELCALEDVNAHDTKLLKTAALFHDSGFTIQGNEHELVGCEIVRKFLPDFDYTDEDIDKICGMIMATKIPQSPKNLLEQILADADLDYLGRDDFFLIGNTLFDELKTLGVIESEEQWNRIQIKFLEAHHFHTRTNIQRREPHKQCFLEKIRKMVD